MTLEELAQAYTELKTTVETLSRRVTSVEHKLANTVSVPQMNSLSLIHQTSIKENASDIETLTQRVATIESVLETIR